EIQRYSVAEGARHLDINRTMLDRWRRKQTAVAQRGQSAQRNIAPRRSGCVTGLSVICPPKQSGMCLSGRSSWSQRDPGLGMNAGHQLDACFHAHADGGDFGFELLARDHVAAHALALQSRRQALGPIMQAPAVVI